MPRTFAKVIVWLLGGIAFFYVLFIPISSWVFGKDAQETWNAMKVSSFVCPEGTEVTFRGWSLNGRMRYCEPLKNGPWEAWADGYRQVQGEFKNGKEHGEWRWFNRDGSVLATAMYSNGQVISDTRAVK